MFSPDSSEPRNLREVIARFDRVVVPEINQGQLALLLQGRFLRPIERLNKVQGLPFSASEIEQRILEPVEVESR